MHSFQRPDEQKLFYVQDLSEVLRSALVELGYQLIEMSLQISPTTDSIFSLLGKQSQV